MNRQLCNFFRYIFVSFLCFLGFLPCFGFAGLYINEIMYDPEGLDDGREWVEIKNEGEAFLLLDLRLKDKNGKHLLKDLSGGTELVPNSCIVVADNVDKFKIDYPSFSGKVIDSSFSFVNTTDTISFLKIGDSETILDSLTYSKDLGASQDGNSLHRKNDNLTPSVPTPGDCGEVTQNVTPISPPLVGSSSTSTTQVVDNGTSVLRIKVEPQIFAYINGEKSALTGVETIFKGTVFGLDKKPIENARFVWSFGDGVSKEGQNVTHTFQHDGSYMVVLETSSGEFNSSARQRVDVTSANLKILEVVSGGNGYISIKNDTNQDVDLSRWIIKSGNQSFTLPAHTIILSGAVLPFMNSISKIDPLPRDVKLFFPNGFLAVSNQTDEKNNSGYLVKEPKTKVSSLTVNPIAKNSKVVKKTVEKETPLLDKEKNKKLVSSSTLLYASPVKSGVFSDWALALIGIIGLGIVGITFSIKKAKFGFGKENVEKEIGQKNSSISAKDFNIIEETED